MGLDEDVVADVAVVVVAVQAAVVVATVVVVTALVMTTSTPVRPRRVVVTVVVDEVDVPVLLTAMAEAASLEVNAWHAQPRKRKSPTRIRRLVVWHPKHPNARQMRRQWRQQRLFKRPCADQSP